MTGNPTRATNDPAKPRRRLLPATNPTASAADRSPLRLSSRATSRSPCIYFPAAPPRSPSSTRCGESVRLCKLAILHRIDRLRWREDSSAVMRLRRADHLLASDGLSRPPAFSPANSAVTGRIFCAPACRLLILYSQSTWLLMHCNIHATDLLNPENPRETALMTSTPSRNWLPGRFAVAGIV